MAAEIWIHNSRLVTQVPGAGIVEQGVVQILDGIIQAVGGLDTLGPGLETARQKKTVRLVDGRGGILMPGLINAHTHTPMTMFRGMADDLPLDVWLNEHIFPAEAAQVNPESVAQWAAHAAREMLLGGITTCCDGYFHQRETALALANEGIRVVAGQGVIDFPAPGVPDPKENLAHAVETVSALAGASPLIHPSIFCHSPYTCGSETLVRAKDAARKAGVLFQIHVAETRGEADLIPQLKGRSIVTYLDDLGILDGDTLLVHGVWISDANIETIAQRGCGLAHCPESNMKLASGIAPVPRMLAAGVPVGLGTDGAASNNDLDIFSEMDTAAKLHKVATLDPCALPAKTALEMATSMGAKAIGLE
ncbi:MAG: amidohydrolase, partial [Desulfobacterales bacterium]|nr:amidohydrolase [Desulfobacterales bacterium]